MKKKLEFLELNSEFSFSQTGCRSEVKEPSLPYYLQIAWVRIVRLIAFPQDNNVINSLVQKITIRCDMHDACLI